MSWAEAFATSVFVVTAGACVAWWLYLVHVYGDDDDDPGA